MADGRSIQVSDNSSQYPLKPRGTIFHPGGQVPSTEAGFQSVSLISEFCNACDRYRTTWGLENQPVDENFPSGIEHWLQGLRLWLSG